jgi:hypothetical protein
MKHGVDRRKGRKGEKKGWEKEIREENRRSKE